MTTIESAIEIDAPAEPVWAILVDIAAYPEWNPFTPRVDTTLEVGTPIVLHVAMRPGTKRILQTEHVTVNDAGKRELGWAMKMGAPFVLRAQRIQRLEALAG